MAKRLNERSKIKQYFRFIQETPEVAPPGVVHITTPPWRENCFKKLANVSEMDAYCMQNRESPGSEQETQLENIIIR
jgi:hypothetical protein